MSNLVKFPSRRVEKFNHSNDNVEPCPEIIELLLQGLQQADDTFAIITELVYMGLAELGLSNDQINSIMLRLGL